MAKQAWFMAALLLFAFPALAGDGKSAPPPKADPDLLEFLGSWQSADGQWVDPMMFASIDPSKAKDQAASRDAKFSSPTPAKETSPDKPPDSDDGGRGT